MAIQSYWWHHDINVLCKSDWLIELGPQAGAKGGMIIAQGTVEEIRRTHHP